MKRKYTWVLIFICIVLNLSACSTSEKSSLVERFESSVSIDLEENLSKWGLGSTIIAYVTNNRDYEWYIDQEFTGTYAGENCGPSTVTMAAKWWDEKTLLTPEKARSKYRKGGGWWYTDDIEATLKDYNIPFDLEYDFSINQMKAHLLKNKVIIICANMSYIPQNNYLNQRTNRFYSYSDGHFFLVKGYVVTEKGTFFEVYDPNNWSMTYENGSPKGKDRYYHEEKLLDAIENWWYGMFVIGK